MLKTALKPRWIVTLILAMALAAVFVLLSQWQFSSSQQPAPAAPNSAEPVRALTAVLEPGMQLTAAQADALVSAEGTFVPGTRVLVQERIQDGRTGLWVVSAFAVGEPADAEPSQPKGKDAAVIPVVLGWVPDAAAAQEVPEYTGAAVITGRLLPPEAPMAERAPAGQVPTLSTAELTNLWDRASYAAFVVPTATVIDGAPAAVEPPLERVVVKPQPAQAPVNWLNIFYAIEWAVFAGFAFFLWWRLVADDHRRALEAAEDARLGSGEGDPAAGPAAGTGASAETTTETTTETSSTTEATTRE